MGRPLAKGLMTLSQQRRQERGQTRSNYQIKIFCIKHLLFHLLSLIFIRHEKGPTSQYHLGKRLHSDGSASDLLPV